MKGKLQKQKELYERAMALLSEIVEEHKKVQAEIDAYEYCIGQMDEHIEKYPNGKIIFLTTRTYFAVEAAKNAGVPYSRMIVVTYRDRLLGIDLKDRDDILVIIHDTPEEIARDAVLVERILSASNIVRL